MGLRKMTSAKLMELILVQPALSAAKLLIERSWWNISKKKRYTDVNEKKEMLFVRDQSSRISLFSVKICLRNLRKQCLKFKIKNQTC